MKQDRNNTKINFDSLSIGRVALILFFVNIAFYYFFRIGISDTLFGGDAIWASRDALGVGSFPLSSWDVGSGSLADVINQFHSIFNEATDKKYSPPGRHIPVTNFYSLAVQKIIWLYSGDITAGVIIHAVTYAIMMNFAWLIAARLIRSVPWALISLLLFQFSMSTLLSSYMLYNPPYILVTMCILAGVYGYLHYRESGNRAMLALFVLASLAGPWIREFASVIPFVAVVSELFAWRGKSSRNLSLICIPLIAHAFFPSALLWLFTGSSEEWKFVFTQGKSLSQLNPSGYNFGLTSFLFLQLPSMIWGLALLGITSHIVELTKNSDRRVIQRLPKIVVIAIAVAAISYLMALYNPGAEHETNHPHWAYDHMKGVSLLMAMFILLFVGSGFRFGAVAPVLFVATFLPFIVLNLAEIHLTFSLLPVCIILTQWIQDFWVRIRRMMTALSWKEIGVLVALAIAITDQTANAWAAGYSTHNMIKTHQEIGRWFANNTPEKSIVIANFLAYPDIYYYSGFHFEPYESTENNPLGQTRTIHTDDQWSALINHSNPKTKIYFLATEPDYFPWRMAYHSHKWVKSPPGSITRLYQFPKRIIGVPNHAVRLT